jgi:hypothetical protein
MNPLRRAGAGLTRWFGWRGLRRKSGGKPPHSKKGEFAGLKAAATKAGARRRDDSARGAIEERSFVAEDAPQDDGQRRVGEDR